MKRVLTILLMFTAFLSFSQEEEDKAQLLALKKANNFVYEGNSLLEDDDAVSAEMEYRKAISEQPNSVVGSYNLGTSYVKNGNLDEAIYRLQAAAKAASSKTEKHKAYHNIGNVLMQGKKCKDAVEAYKNALRNDPTDDETRYNLGLAKVCAEQQKDQNQDKDQDGQDENKDNKDQKEDDQSKDNQENKDNKDQEGEDNEDKKDEGDQDKKEGEDEKDDEGKPKDDKKDKGNEGDEKKEQPKPRPQQGQLSPQQVKNLLEAMNNQEQEVQEKMNAEKQKGVIIQTDKDW
ncbi:tetratricopeptide repeat protein [Flavisericum labens]|uniref:tetratricopeptide repeat protein n=1 Tax=Flavisericum labens TaxID=3377112 RepID=UPI00387A9289